MPPRVRALTSASTHVRLLVRHFPRAYRLMSGLAVVVLAGLLLAVDSLAAIS